MTVLIFSFKKKDTVSSAALMFLVIYVGTEMNCCVTLMFLFVLLTLALCFGNL